MKIQTLPSLLYILYIFILYNLFFIFNFFIENLVTLENSNVTMSLVTFKFSNVTNRFFSPSFSFSLSPFSLLKPSRSLFSLQIGPSMKVKVEPQSTTVQGNQTRLLPVSKRKDVVCRCWDGSENKRRSLYELSLSLIFSLWCLVFLFYFRLGLGHGNGCKFSLTLFFFFFFSHFIWVLQLFLPSLYFFFRFWVNGFGL